jgi:DNA-directed RNA polymerase specialized sigma subunit|uniref:Sigma-70 family RNA polymerase sigma factor n=1 Tax=Siphoviridae sp. ctWDo30 TaxID=2826360 RepID=A0A8S5N644_9CAUD|nr:MAG TPA: Protein of unknown function (DUF722) [Siphoviridae sp. ctWDo30]
MTSEHSEKIPENKPMTKERLEKYISCKEEITELEYLLAHLGEGDTMIDNDVIYDYQTGFPRPQTVVGFDQKKYEQRKRRYEKRKLMLEKECEEIEEFVEAIPDSLTRRIFRMYFINGIDQQSVADRVHLDRSRISRRIDEYLKNAHKAHNAHV